MIEDLVSPQIPIPEVPPEKIYEKQSFQEGVEPMCLIHEKTIEAYCQEDCVLVCIGCILSNDHKGHTLHSIEKAIDLEIFHIGKEHKKSKEVLGDIEKQKKEIQDKLTSILDSINVRKTDISALFDDIRKTINEKEQKLFAEVDEKFEQTNNLLIK